jgi:hypothetical protein
MAKETHIFQAAYGAHVTPVLSVLRAAFPDFHFFTAAKDYRAVCVVGVVSADVFSRMTAVAAASADAWQSGYQKAEDENRR